MRLLEFDSHSALKLWPGKISEIRQIQENYRDYIQLFRANENDQSLTPFKKGGAKSIYKSNGFSVSKKALDKSFFASLKASNVNGANVAVALFEPNRTLHSIYMNFRKEMKALY